VVVYFGTEASGASQTFTAVEEEEEEEAPAPEGGVGVAPVSLSTIYNKLLEVQNELGFHGKTRTAYQDMRIVKSWIGALPGQLSQPLYKEITNTSAQLSKTVALLGEKIDPLSPGFKSLLEISQANVSDLQEMKNKLADLRAVSSITQRLVEQTIGQPIIETWMTFDSVVINFLITNPVNEARTMKFKAYLPVEVGPEHIMDLSGLNINYDTNAASYYVYGDITLGPKEAIVRKVEIKDIWVFPDKEIESLKKQAETLAQPLARTQYEALGTVLKNEIEATLEIILLRQNEGYRTPQDHIVTHRENVKRMEQVNRNLEKLRDLVVQAGASRGVIGKIGGIQTFSTWGIILAIVFGFGLLAAVIFAMWRHQTMLAMAAMSTDKKEILAILGRKKRLKKKPVKTGVLKSVAFGAGSRIKSGVSSIRVPFIWRLPWKKILIWVVVIGVVVVLGFLTIKFAPGLFSTRTIIFEKTPAAAPVEESTKSIIPETQENVEVFFREPLNPKLKILDTPTNWLNVRDTASLDGNIITKVYPNEQYEYTDEKDGWYFITIPKGKSGWVFGEYVQEIEN
jgi:hypothetical protein